ncbi:hypothetical protein BSKO_03145 [Bryopsis sp. KO-2023]|nr:hypothetical protein BSKO_03145 [Bryopsis sp. KO-2023]
MDQVDRLRPSTHLTLKVAAVVSTNITVGLLRDIYPSATTREALEEDLVELEQTGFIRQSVTNVNSWQFTTMVARDVVYGLIPSSQQQQLHAKLGEVLTGYGKKVPTTAIAFHWSQSCLGDEVAEWRRAVMAMRWWERAANEAGEKWALAEAVRLYQKAADLASILARFYERREERDVAEFMLKGQESEASFTDAFSKPSSPSLSPTIPLLKRVWWERRMSDLCLLMSENDLINEKASENRHNAKKHVLTGLSLLRAPLPGDDTMALGEGCQLCARIVQCASGKAKGFDATEFGEEGSKHIARFLEILFSLSVERPVDDRVDMALLNYCWKLTGYYRGDAADEDSSLYRITQKIKKARDGFYTGEGETSRRYSQTMDPSKII